MKTKKKSLKKQCQHVYLVHGKPFLHSGNEGFLAYIHKHVTSQLLTRPCKGHYEEQCRFGEKIQTQNLTIYNIRELITQPQIYSCCFRDFFQS